MAFEYTGKVNLSTNKLEPESLNDSFYKTFVGTDAQVFDGKSETPIHLLIQNGHAEVRPSDHLKGNLTGGVETLIKEEVGDKAEITLNKSTQGGLPTRNWARRTFQNTHHIDGKNGCYRDGFGTEEDKLPVKL